MALLTFYKGQLEELMKARRVKEREGERADRGTSPAHNPAERKREREESGTERFGFLQGVDL